MAAELSPSSPREPMLIPADWGSVELTRLPNKDGWLEVVTLRGSRGGKNAYKVRLPRREVAQLVGQLVNDLAADVEHETFLPPADMVALIARCVGDLAGPDANSVWDDGFSHGRSGIG